jgi:hypothetical protein
VFIYNEISYTVRQSHTSQADWLPNVVLALYLPQHNNNNQVSYLPPESDNDAPDYIAMSREELINFMDFQYVGSELNSDSVDYTWTYIHPQISENKISWLYKPLTVKLDYSTIAKCLGSYTEQTCYNGLISGTETINYYDETGAIESTVVSVKEKAADLAFNAINRAVGLQVELENQNIYGGFVSNDLSILVE